MKLCNKFRVSFILSYLPLYLPPLFSKTGGSNSKVNCQELETSCHIISGMFQVSLKYFSGKDFLAFTDFAAISFIMRRHAFARPLCWAWKFSTFHCFAILVTWLRDVTPVHLKIRKRRVIFFISVFFPFQFFSFSASLYFFSPALPLISFKISLWRIRGNPWFYFFFTSLSFIYFYDFQYFSSFADF